MATEEPYHEATGPGRTEGYISPTADFLLLFALTAVVGLLTASVLLP